MAITQCDHPTIGQGSNLTTAGIRTAKLIGIKHPLGLGPGLAAIGAAAQEAGAVGAFEGFTNEHCGQERTVRKLTDIGEGCLTAAELGDGILINDVHFQRFHNIPP